MSLEEERVPKHKVWYFNLSISDVLDVKILYFPFLI